MSRFSQAEAEARGWKIVHEQTEQTVETSATQGEFRTTPASYVAEKWFNDTPVHEQAESIGKLLEKIEWQESRFEALSAPTAFNPEPEPAVAEEISEGVFHVKPGGGAPSPLTDNVVIGPSGEKFSDAQFHAVAADGSSPSDELRELTVDKEDTRAAAGVSIADHDKFQEAEEALELEDDLEDEVDDEEFGEGDFEFVTETEPEDLGAEEPLASEPIEVTEPAETEVAEVDTTDNTSEEEEELPS